jgi:hypothetical protein
MRRHLLDLLKALSLVLFATVGGCSRHTVSARPDADVIRHSSTARTADAPDIDAPLPTLRLRKPCLPSDEDEIVHVGERLNTLLDDLRRYSATLDDPGTTEDERHRASAGLRVTKAELRRWSMELIDLVEPTSRPGAPDEADR